MEQQLKEEYQKLFNKMQTQGLMALNDIKGDLEIKKTKLPRKLKKKYKKDRMLALTFIHKPICSIDKVSFNITVE